MTCRTTLTAKARPSDFTNSSKPARSNSPGYGSSLVVWAVHPFLKATMPRKDAYAYTRSEKGRAANLVAKRKYLAKIKKARVLPPNFNAAPLEAALHNWTTS